MTQPTLDAAAIRDAVDVFYDRVTRDAALAHYWVGVDQPKLRHHAHLFLLGALGGPADYGRDLASAHRDLGIGEDDFDAVVLELMVSLREVGLSDDIIELARRRIEELRSLIVAAA